MRALVSRPREDADRLANPLRAMGVEVLNEPLLVIVPTAGPDVDLTGIQALLFTSANGVRALATALDRRDLPVFAVGDQTARVAREVGFKTVNSAGGDVEALARLVAAALDPQDGTLLHAAGAVQAGDLSGALEAKGFSVRIARLYDARPTAALSEALQGRLRRGEIDVAFFYSPRTARIFVGHVRAAGLTGHLAGMTGYALSPAVARVLEPVLPGRVRVATQPTQDALLDLFQSDLKEASLKQPDTADNGTPQGSADPDPHGRASDETTRPPAAADGPGRPADAPDNAPDNAPADAPPSDDPGTGTARTPQAESGGESDGDPASADRTADEGEGVYAGSSGLGVPKSGDKTAPTAEEQADHHTLRSMGRWIVAIVVIGAIGYGSMPWWRESVPEPARSWLPTLPEPSEPAAVTDLRTRVEALATRLDAQAETVAAVRADLEAVATTAAKAASAAAAADARTPAGGDTPAEAGIDPAALTALRDRLDALEGAVQAAGAGATSEAVASAARVDALAKDVAALAGRLDALEVATGEEGEARAVGLLLAIGQLRDQVDSGQTYDEALSAVAVLAPTTSGLSDPLETLASHAGSGVPTVETLRRAYAEASRIAARRVITPEGNDWWTDTLASLMESVTVRRTDEVVAGGTLSALSAAEARLAVNDLPGAIEALSSLTGDPAAAVADWLSDAKARASVNAALASLHAAALERVGAAQTSE